ncbi:MAG: uroporphyrinogen decarboxylase [Verrucomicrobia bacterium]|jgi:uroporphyrinogen decarboxylase|nr:uroporphyrinogen decarboxylase [Verrucomicrobiota bacterium]
MNKKTLLLNALRGEATERAPWVPFVGVHGGALIGVDAEAYLKSADHMVAALKIAAESYQPDGLPVVFDLQLEAEILGCELSWARETPPSVSSHPLDEDYKLAALPEFSTEKGRLPQVLDAIRRCKAEFGDDIALYGLLTGPLTLALHLRGDDVLLDMFDEEDEVPELLDYCAGIALQMVDAYIEAGIDVVAVVDPMISQIGPGHFSDFVAPPMNRIFDHIRARGALSSLFVCGNATRNLEAMCATTCDNISVDENVDLAQLAKVARAAGKSFGGNLQLTVVLLLGDSIDATRDAVRCIDQAGALQGFVLAPGCDLPYAVKPENLAAIAALIRDPNQIEIVRKLPPKDSSDSFDDIVIPNYAEEAAVIVDVVTLDSAGCAPCAYMLKAAQEAARVYGQAIEVLEHKITGRDGLGYMTKLGCTAIPSICIDGKEVFASIIPDRKELVAELEAAAAAKA